MELGQFYYDFKRAIRSIQLVEMDFIDPTKYNSNGLKSVDKMFRSYGTWTILL